MLKMNAEVSDITLDGTYHKTAIPVESLMASNRISFGKVVVGNSVTFHRAACCSYCGEDTHLQKECQRHQALMSDHKASFTFKLGKGKTEEKRVGKMKPRAEVEPETLTRRTVKALKATKKVKKDAKEKKARAVVETPKASEETSEMDDA
jgi:ribosome biogenesis protein Tsr3